MGRHTIPFDLEFIHTAGSTIGMADYLSRHPSELEGASVKAKMLCNGWFTVNSVINLNDLLDSSAEVNERSQPEKVKIER